MTEVETELDSRYDDIDVDSILARCQRQMPIKFSRKTSLYQAPEFIKRLPSTEEVEEGSTVCFTCKVAGFPKPTVKWYRDEEILGPDSRAKIDAEDSGIHSIKIKDVSKCDAGIYKIHASNLEGSSKSMLYISVKARSKRRNKKKSKRSGNVARSPLFPAIIERVTEEEKETLENEGQPDSPLTPLYCSISRKAPVISPVFSGEWAYNEDEALQQGEIEELGVGCEDVFETEIDKAITESLTFVSSAYRQISDPKSEISSDCAQNNVLLKSENKTPDAKAVGYICSLNLYDDSNQKNEFSDVNQTQTFCEEDLLSEETSQTSDKLNNNDKDIAGNYERNDTQKNSDSQDMNVSHQTELKSKYCDPRMVSIISVHRSYAKGDSTSSVARRSPSPFSRSLDFNRENECLTYVSDTSTLQNLNNERILQRMNKETSLCHTCWSLLCSFATTTRWDEYLWEIIFCISGSTFMALCFDLPPMAFVYYILIALFLKMVLCLVLEDM